MDYYSSIVLLYMNVVCLYEPIFVDFEYLVN